jgi:ABC transporter
VAQFHTSADGLAVAERLLALVEGQPAMGSGFAASPSPRALPVRLEGVSFADAGREGEVLDSVGVASLPDGLDTLVGEAGSAVSGGQRQRLVLARALLADAPVLVLDEPTAHLDPSTAAELMDDVLDATADKTVLLITSPARRARAHGRDRRARRGQDRPRPRHDLRRRVDCFPSPAVPSAASPPRRRSVTRLAGETDPPALLDVAV